jgi:uncharacterized Rmd1/YagE family protein
MRCLAFCTASSYQLNELFDAFRTQGYTVHRFKNVLHRTHPHQRGDVFFFQHGCFVAWDLSPAKEKEILLQITPFAIDPLEQIEFHPFIHLLGEKIAISTHPKFNTDVITLTADETDNAQIKLAISYGLSQSVKLQSYETSIQKTVSANHAIPQELAKFGRISLSRKAISKRIGEIFLAKSAVNLGKEYLDVSEYFWRNSHLEFYYLMTEKFLDIQKRVNLLNRRLDVVHDIFVMLNNQLQHRYSSILEIIIIFLIFSEIFINMLYRL